MCGWTYLQLPSPFCLYIPSHLPHLPASPALYAAPFPIATCPLPCLCYQQFPLFTRLPLTFPTLPLPCPLPRDNRARFCCCSPFPRATPPYITRYLTLVPDRCLLLPYHPSRFPRSPTPLPPTPLYCPTAPGVLSACSSLPVDGYGWWWWLLFGGWWAVVVFCGFYSAIPPRLYRAACRAPLPRALPVVRVTCR